MTELSGDVVWVVPGPSPAENAAFAALSRVPDELFPAPTTSDAPL